MLTENMIKRAGNEMELAEMIETEANRLGLELDDEVSYIDDAKKYQDTNPNFSYLLDVAECKLNDLSGLNEEY